MPHLAPLSWALAPILFWLILLSISSSLWWSLSPSFPNCVAQDGSSYFKPWNWS